MTPPNYEISQRYGYTYVHFEYPPPAYIRNRMRAAGMYFSKSEGGVWVADDRLSPTMIIRLIGMNGNNKRKEAQP